MNSIGLRVAQWGFDPAQLGFALRTALAGFLAIVLAWALGLDYPQWAGMTVWIAAQPTRGHLLAKSAFRIVGTLVGALAGLTILMLARGDVLLLVLGLTAWSAWCVGLGNVLRGYVSYASILSGYTAAMVALVGAEYHGGILLLGIDRVLTVLLGVVVALAAGWFFTGRTAEDVLTRSARQSAGRMLRYLATRLRTDEVPAPEAERNLLAEIANLEDALDGLGAGSLRSRRSVQLVRALLFSQVSLVMWCKRRHSQAAGSSLPARLEIAAKVLETGGSYREVRKYLAPLGEEYPISLRSLMLPFMAGLAAVLPDAKVPIDSQSSTGPELEAPGAERQTQLVVLHRDWVGARQAMLRASAAMLLVGLLWWMTAWQPLSYMLLGTAIMTTLFSTFENPARTMRVVLFGQAMGVVGALLCRWLLWPLAGSVFEQIVLLAPFMLLGALLVAHRRTSASAFDYNMVALLLLMPAYPLLEAPGQSLAKGLAVLAAPILAAAAYYWVFPVSTRRRLDTLIAEMVRELEHLAASPTALQRRKTWQARLYHRMMRLVVGADRLGERGLAVIDGGAAVLSLGTAIFQAQALMRQSDLSLRLHRHLDVLLRRTTRIANQPVRVARSLRRTAAMLQREAPTKAQNFEDAARALEGSLDFFTGKLGPSGGAGGRESGAFA